MLKVKTPKTQHFQGFSDLTYMSKSVQQPLSSVHKNDSTFTVHPANKSPGGHFKFTTFTMYEVNYNNLIISCH